MARKTRSEIDAASLAAVSRSLSRQLDGIAKHLRVVKQTPPLIMWCGALSPALSSFLISYALVLSRLGLEPDEVRGFKYMLTRALEGPPPNGDPGVAKDPEAETTQTGEESSDDQPD